MDFTKFKCVFSDLDKTLLATGSVLSEYTKETIEMLTSRGIEFIPSSGRAFNSLPKDLFSVKGLKYCVTSNGVTVNSMTDGTPLSTMCIPQDEIDALHSFLGGMDVAIEYFVEGQGYGNRDYYEHPEKYKGYLPERMPYYHSTRKPLNNVEEFLAANKAKIEAFDILAEPSLISDLDVKLRKEFPELYLTHSENYLIEISHADSGKHRGMERCCRILGIQPEQCIAFGDAANDMEMLGTAGLGIAVANASQECKAAADFVSDFTNDQDSVAREIRKIFSL